MNTCRSISRIRVTAIFLIYKLIGKSRGVNTASPSSVILLLGNVRPLDAVDGAMNASVSASIGDQISSSALTRETGRMSRPCYCESLSIGCLHRRRPAIVTARGLFLCRERRRECSALFSRLPFLYGPSEQLSVHCARSAPPTAPETFL